MGLLDFIFPKRCVVCRKFGEYICPDCFSQISFDVEKMCMACNRPAVDGKTHPGCRTRYTVEGAIASVVYKGVMRRLISAFKYKPYLSDIQHVLTDLFYEGLIQQELFHQILQKECILVPVPLHSEKLRQRSYNQAEILAMNLGKRLNIPVVPLLKRVKQTKTQVALKREDRLGNIKGAFEIDKAIIKSQRARESKMQSNKQIRNFSEALTLCNFDSFQVILVDDVITSGATMLEAANVLKRNGFRKVWGIALAHGK